MKLLQRMARIEARDLLPDEHRRMVAEDAAKFAGKIRNYADELPAAAVHMTLADRVGTMSAAMQLAWHMRFVPVQA